MTAHRFISILVRVAGLVMFVAVLRQQVPYLAQFTQNAILRPEDVLALTTSVVLIMAAVVMALLPGLVAGKLLGGGGHQPMATAWSASELQTALITAIGLWMLIDGAVNASYWIAYWAIFKTEVERTRLDIPHSAETVAGAVSTIAQLVLGLAILINATGIAHRLRRLGGN